MPNFLTCTDQLQQWNQPRGRHVDIIPVEQLGSRRRELVPTPKRTLGSGEIFDPRPHHLRHFNPLVRLERLRCDLQDLSQPCGLLNIIVPSIEKVEHDHSYCCKSTSKPSPAYNSTVPADYNMSLSIPMQVVTEEQVLESFQVTAEERQSIEKDTRNQSSSSKWHNVRHRRITGSKCGRIIIQKEKTVALLQFCLYPKPMLYLPKPIAWDRENEAIARNSYVTYMRGHGHPHLTVSEAGFIVHLEKCWLGASPDAWIIDPSAECVTGLAEFKCPFIKADMLLEEACQDSKF